MGRPAVGGQRALVLGRGTSGTSAAALLGARGYAVDFAENYDLVVASPGVPVASELQLGAAELRSRGWRLLGVTGSKGKSSVVKLVAEALARTGANAVPCGNYGRAVTDLVTERPGWAVVEVSSFQLETTTLAPDTFRAAALLNLQEDHLDRHGSVGAYHALKRRLLAFAEVAVDGTALGAASARENALYAGSYFDNEILRGNARCAIRLLEAAGVPDDVTRAAFAAFAPLPHRMQDLGVYGGLRCIDDSKATSLAALAAGVRMCSGPVRLIAGGLEKGDDPFSCASLLTSRVKKVYLIGHSAELFLTAWKGVVDCEVCGTLERAVSAAMREAGTGETLLLSPGTASYDQFESFGERGEVFARLVKEERKRT